MDKTFNFFKSKARKDNERPRNSSKSNSSKVSKQSNKAKPALLKPEPLSKKQKEIRQAIEIRYQKSKLRLYTFCRANEPTRRQRQASGDSAEMEQYQHLRKMTVVDLKEYHRKQESITISFSNHSSQEKKKFNLRFKLRDNSSGIMRTEGDEPQKQTNFSKAAKDATPNRTSKNAEEWRFISIQLKEDLLKPKTRKTEIKINSHRSYNLQQEKPRMKTNSSVNKGLDKASNKTKGLNRPIKTKL